MIIERSRFQLSVQNRNQSNHNNQSEQSLSSSLVKVNSNWNKLHETREMRITKSQLVQVVYLIVWEGGMSFLDQSQSEVMDYFRSSIENFSIALILICNDQKSFIGVVGMGKDKDWVQGSAAQVIAHYNQLQWINFDNVSIIVSLLQ